MTLLYAGDRKPPLRLRAFVDLLAERLGSRVHADGIHRPKQRRVRAAVGP